MTERTTLELQTVPQVTRERAQRLSRQIRIQARGDRVHAHRVERKRTFRLEARRPITQECQLEARVVDRRWSRRRAPYGLAQARPGVAIRERLSGVRGLVARDLLHLPRHPLPFGQSDPVCFCTSQLATIGPRHTPAELQHATKCG